jgi:CubicO group peptidase (beta-lactamase class C family)
MRSRSAAQGLARATPPIASRAPRRRGDAQRRAIAASAGVRGVERIAESLRPTADARPEPTKNKGDSVMRAFLSARAAAAVLTAIAFHPALAADLGMAAPEAVGMSADRLARLDSAIHAYVDKGRTPGVVTLIARHGKIVHVDAYGPAEIGGRKTSKDDIFRMYSMTKPITSVALLMLYEEGKFQLTDPLAKYYPAFKDVKVLAGMDASGQMRLEAPKRPMTIEDVFRHTAGFSYGFGDSPVDALYQKEDFFTKDLTNLMAKLPTFPLLYQPGERWVYSVSHDVQAALVEHLSGMKFDEFVRTRIFEPLGMKDSMFRIPADKKARVPALYTAGQDGKIAKATGGIADGYGNTVFGGLSISTSAGDYAKFAQMLLNKGELDGVRLLSPKTVEHMATNHLPEAAMNAGGLGIGAASGTGYGLGVSVLLDPVRRGNLGSAGEFGWSGAASTHVLIDPKEDLVAIYCTQLLGGDFGLRAEFATLVYQSIVGE